MVVKKAINMARMMEVPILGLIENMGSMVCPHCGRRCLYLAGAGLKKVRGGRYSIGLLPLDGPVRTGTGKY